jgi:predicted nucleic acid-binding protein
MILDIRDHFRTSLDQEVLEFLIRKSPGATTTVEELHRNLKKREKRIRASLHRLREKQLAEMNEMGYWHRVVLTKEN